jgi:hypothetical protein
MQQEPQLKTGVARRQPKIPLGMFFQHVAALRDRPPVGVDHQPCRIPVDPVAVPPPLGQFFPEPLQDPWGVAFPGTPRGDRHRHDLETTMPQHLEVKRLGLLPLRRKQHYGFANPRGREAR